MHFNLRQWYSQHMYVQCHALQKQFFPCHIHAQRYRALTMIYNHIGDKPRFLRCHHITYASNTYVPDLVSCAFSLLIQRIFVSALFYMLCSIFRRKLPVCLCQAELCSAKKMADHVGRQLHVHNYNSSCIIICEQCMADCIARRQLSDPRLALQ